MDREIRIEAEGLGFPEGPVALPDGAIAFVDLKDACVRVFRGGSLSVLADLPGAPNGMRLGDDGILYVANNGGIWPEGLEMGRAADPIDGCIMAVSQEGAWEVHAGGLPDPLPNRPNDLVFSPEGDIVFTNPQNWEVMLSDRGSYRGGRLMLARENGSVELLAETEGFPNGLGFAPDGSLIVAKTLQHRYERYEWRGGEPLGEPEVFAQLDERFFPDGMVWHEGRMYGAGSAGNRIVVLDEAGAEVEMIDTGRSTHPTNICVDRGRLWATLSKAGQLASLEL